MACDQFVAALQTQKDPCAFQLAFGKNTDDLALRNFFRRSTNSGTRIASIDWDTTERAQDRVKDTVTIMLLVDDVPNRARASELQNDGINPGDVIGQKQEPALREVFQSQRS